MTNLLCKYSSSASRLGESSIPTAMPNGNSAEETTMGMAFSSDGRSGRSGGGGVTVYDPL